MSKVLAVVLAFSMVPASSGRTKQKQQKEISALERYIEEATKGQAGAGQVSPGSLWSSASPFGNLAGDVRATQVNDTVTILVQESATAVASGATKTARNSSMKSSVTSLAGPVKGGALANLAGASTATALDGQGSTTRQTTLTTTVSARVTHVLPNGYLVVEGVKEIQVNSERQTVTVRGVVRPSDLVAGNIVESAKLAQLEVRINGKGVVNDAVRRPMFLYRLLLGLLPF